MIIDYTFPRTRFVDRNTLSAQLEHIRTELLEVVVAYSQPDEHHLATEFADVWHSTETALRIMEERFDLKSKPFSVPVSLPLYEQVRRLTSRLDSADIAFTGRRLTDLGMTLCDIVACVKSALDVMERFYSIKVDVILAEVVAKNMARGYYEAGLQVVFV